MKALIAAAALFATPAASMAQYIYSQPTYSAPSFNSSPSYIPRSYANDAIPGQMQQREDFEMKQEIYLNSRDRKKRKQKEFYDY